MKCLVCEKNCTISSLAEGTYFRSFGNYGSTVFDPMDGQYLDIIICNKCLAERADMAICGREWKPVLCRIGNYPEIMVGRARTPDRKEVPFNPKVMGSFDFEDALYVEPEEVGSDLPIEWVAGAVDLIRKIMAKRQEK